MLFGSRDTQEDGQLLEFFLLLFGIAFSNEQTEQCICLQVCAHVQALVGAFAVYSQSCCTSF